MIQIIGFSQFCDAFSDTYKNNFTYKGKRALFDYLEQIEAETGEDIQLDTIALCCDYSEYDSALECAKEYGYGDLEGENSEEDAREWLADRTTLIDVDGGAVIIQQF